MSEQAGEEREGSAQIGELERAHRVRHAELERRVDVLLRGDARLERDDGLVDERLRAREPCAESAHSLDGGGAEDETHHEQSVRNEACGCTKVSFVLVQGPAAEARGRRTGRVGRQRHRLAHALGKAARDVEDGRVGLERRDELDELHDRDRVDYARKEEGSARAERGALAVALPPTPSTPSLAIIMRRDAAADEKERHAQKWNPTTCLARFSPVLELTADAARVDSEMLDVLLARMACGGRCVASEPKMACLTGSDSETACRSG